MKDAQLAIGVFDSGMGGLTVLREMRAVLPQESFIYLGDTARLPYGTKSEHTVQQYAAQMARLLIEREIKALVIACNTATTAALPHLKAMLPDIPILGVIEPGASAAIGATKNKRIVVLATETTIAAKAYQRLIHEQIPEVVIHARACSVLVALAEEGLVDNAMARAALLHYLSGMTDEDTVLLGCTHFPVFKSLLSSLLPAGVRVVDSAYATAVALKALLSDKQVQATRDASDATVQYLVTDSASRFRTVGEIFLGESLGASSVELIDI